jgi:hypothetical protein
MILSADLAPAGKHRLQGEQKFDNQERAQQAGGH